jgi:nucleoside-diphosphate-sugar epimerase
MKILVTGGAGYLGTTLVPQLVDAGHDVVVVDRFFFGRAPLERLSKGGHLTLVQEDVRWVSGTLFQGIDAVVDMAALSNDPAGDLDPWKTFEINYLGRSRTARLAREAGVRRYILTSSCSVYGFQDGLLTEESSPKPQTAYARANLLAEGDVLPLKTADFAPIAIRFATLYGVSARMRFDLAVNAMVLRGLQTGKLPVMKDGDQWRPFLHVADAARAIGLLLGSDTERFAGRTINVGADDQNFQLRDLAELLAAAVTTHPTLEWYGAPDHRSYRVSFERAEKELGFKPAYRPIDTAHEIERDLKNGGVDTGPRSMTVDWYRHLLTDPAASAEVSLHGIVL